MSEYDLGTAHGSIEIDSDVDSDGVIRKLRRIRESVDQMSRNFKQAEDRMSRFERVAARVQRSAVNVASTMSRVTRSLSEMGRVAVTATANMSGLTSAFQDLRDGSVAAAKGLLSAQQALADLTSISGAARAALSAIGGAGKELENFPEWAKGVVKASAALGTFGAVSSKTGTAIRSKLIPWAHSSVAGFTAFSVSAVLMSNRLRSLTFALGMAFPQLNTLYNSTARLGRSLRQTAGNFGGIINGMSRAVIGAAVFTSGLKSLSATLSKVAPLLKFVGIGVLGLAALGPIGTVILGLVDALKQLGGIVNLLPSALSMLAVAGGVAVVGIMGMSKAFKAGLEDGEKFDEAVKDLSPTLRKFATDIKEIRGPFKAMADEITRVSFNNFTQNFRAITKTYFPLMWQGSYKVSQGMNVLTGSLVRFLMQGQTVQDINTLFGHTATVMTNVGKSTEPVLSGLRDIGVVGTQYLADASNGMSGLAATFAAWAAQARASGEITRWIEESVQGFKDLGHATMEFSRGIGKIFKAFGGDGDNALSKLSDAAEKFNKAIEGSLKGGVLKTIVEQVNSISSHTFETLGIAVKEVYEVFEAFLPIIESFGDAFSGTLQTSLTLVGGLLQGVGKALSFLDKIGLGQIIGSVAALAAAFKMLTFVVGPMIAVLKMAFGAGAVVSGIQTAMVGAAAAVERFAARAGALSGVAGRAANGLLGMATMLSGPVVAGIMAAVVALTMWYSAAQKQKEQQRQIQEDYKASADAAKEFAAAVMDAGGKLSTESMDKLAESVKKNREALKGEAGNDAKWNNVASDMAGDVLGGITFGLIGDSGSGDDISKNMDEAAAKAKLAQEAIDNLNLSNQELAQYLVSSDSTYANFESRLRAQGDAGNLAADRLDELRNKTQAVLKTAQAVGPANMAIANGIRVLADESSSASEKLNALKSVLQALGFLQTSAADAAAQWTQEVSKIAQTAQSAVDSSQALGQAILNSNGSINTATANGANLQLMLSGLSDKYLATALATGDARTAFSQMQPQIGAIASAFGLTTEQMQRLLPMFGFVPDEVQTLISIKGSDTAQADLMSIMQQLRGLPTGKDVTITANTNEAIEGLKRAGVIVKEWNPETKGVKINIPPNLGQDAITKIAAMLRQAGVPETEIKAKLDPTTYNATRKQLEAPVTVPQKPGAPANPAPNTNPNPAPNLPGQQNINVTIGGGDHIGILNRIKAAVDGLPSSKTVNVIIGGGDHLGILARLKAAVDGLPAQKVVNVIIGGGNHLGILANIANSVRGLPNSKNVNVIIGGGDHLGILNNITNAVNNIPGQKNVNVTVSGVAEAIGAIDGLIGKLNEIGTAANNAANTVKGAMDRAVGAFNNAKNAITQVGTAMQNVANTANSRGAALGQGFADGINSKADAVRSASMNLARAAAEPLPSSPAKIGPFSGRGWTPFRGRALAEGFAKGIHSGSDETQRASLDMVAQIASAMDSIRTAFGLTPTFFNENRTPGAGGKRYYRDPEITDAELAEKRKEKAEKQAEKDEIAAEKAADKIPDAKKAISDAEDRIAKAEDRAAKARARANDPSLTAKQREKAETSATNAEEALDKAKQNLDNRKSRLKELEDNANGSAGSSTVAGSGNPSSRDAQKVDEFVKSLDNAQYGMGGFSAAVLDCSAFVSAVANTATGRAPFSERANTTNLRPFLLKRGFKEGKGGTGDLSIAWWDNGGGQNGHAALTTGTGLNAESTTGGVRFGNGSAGARSNNSQFTNFMYLPLGDSKNIEKIANNTGNTAESTEKTIPLIKKADGTYGSSNAAWDHLIQRESGGNFKIVQGIQDANSGGNEASGGFQIAKGTWASHGGTKFAPTAGQATPEQQAIIAARIFEKSGGAPWGAGLPGRESEAELRAGLTTVGNNTGQTATNTATGSKSAEDTVAELRANNKKLDQAITTAQDPNASEGQVIRALQDIDDEMVGMSATERQAIGSIREGAMADRGLKEYDPYENAPETPEEWFNTIFNGLAQNFLGLYKSIEEGLSNAADMAHLLVRGFSNTKDVNNFIDGMQSLANTALQVVSTVGSIVETVANIAAAAGSAIPGIGQVSAVIGAIGGVGSNIQAVIDFGQELFHIGSRWFGKGLSSLLGLGGTGELQGQIKTLLDMNDNTIKTWSDRNAADKSVIGMPGTKPNDPNQTGNFRDLNIYQGPGQDPAEMMNNAMFAVAAHSQGVYGG